MFPRNPIRHLASILALAMLLSVIGVAEDSLYSIPVEFHDSLTGDEVIQVGEEDIIIQPELSLDLSVEGDSARAIEPAGSAPEDAGEADEFNGIPKALTLGVNEAFALYAKKVSYQSSKPAVATVDQTGVITARKKGTAKIAVKSGKKTVATCKVTVVAAPKKVELDLKSVSMGTGEALTLAPAIPKGSHTSFTYASTNRKVATVSAKGVISARKLGSAKIVVKTHNGRKASLKVTVRKAPSKIAVSPKALTLEVGESATLAANLPAKTASHKLTWTSSDQRVAKVGVEGHVIAIGAGTAQITVRTYNKKKATCTVNVTIPEPTAEPTAEPKADPTAEPGEETPLDPTIAPTPGPTDEPTPEPTSEPTLEPTLEPTPEPAEGWVLTQYPDASGNNGLCYSLVNRMDGALILVDGGWRQNADTVRKIIDDNGGKVKAWFLTHYHGDHIGAFNEVYGEYRDSIETIYVNPLDWETFDSVAKYWDTPEEFASFLNQTANADNVVRLRRNDRLTIDGASVYVYSAFDDVVKKITGDWPNNSSLVFKLSLEEDSILFLGDVHTKEMSQYLLDTYGSGALHADYIQSGHHGNASIPNEFYGALRPSVIFLDGPEWLMTGESYKAKDLLAWCAGNGIQTYDYRQAPNSFILN